MPRPERMSEPGIVGELASLVGWARQGDAIAKLYTLETFMAAIAFVSRVAALAESHDHHPDILIQHRRVTLTLSTHDASGLTSLDFALARAVDA